MNMLPGGMPLWWNLSALGSLARGKFDSGPWILLYHRIAPKPHSGGETTPEQFDEHVEVLRKHCDCVPLTELLQRVREGRATGMEATITFDDGYRDQAVAARSARSRGVHSTIFVPTEYPGSGRRFFWEGRSSDECEVIKAAMREGTPPPEGLLDSDLMSWEEIAALSKEGVGIESHAHSHRILAGLSDTDLREEMNSASRVFEEKLGRKPEIIAYPNGDWPDFNDRVDRQAGESGFRNGVTAVFGSARRAHLPWRIRRLSVTDQSASALARALRGGNVASSVKAFMDDWRGRR